jgi:hypothetical protein
MREIQKADNRHAARGAPSDTRAGQRYLQVMPEKPTRRIGPARVFRLGEEPLDNMAESTTPEERLEMVAVLSARMRELSGAPAEPLRRDHVTMRSLRDS